MKRKGTILTRIFCLTMIFLLCIPALSGCGESADEPVKTEITSALIDNKAENIKVEATFSEEFVSANKKEKIYIFALDTPLLSEKISTDKTPIDDKTVKSKLKFEIPLSNGRKNRLNSAIVLATYVEQTADSPAYYKAIANAFYVQNPEKLSSGASGGEYPSSIKGISTTDVGEASFLGASHILIDVWLDEILLQEYQSGSVTYDCGGLTYFFNPEKIDAIDKKIKSASENGIKVYLRFLLGMPEKNSDGEYVGTYIESLYCPDAEVERAAYMINMTNPEALGYVDAVFGLFCDRYGKDSGYGTASDFIIGKNANSYGYYNHAGSLGEEEYQICYNALVRRAYNTLHSRNSDGKVYASVSSLWLSESSGGGVIGAKTFLNKFLANATAGSDFGWDVSLSMPVSNTALWNDPAQTSDHLTPNSLHELTDTIASEAFCFDSTPRKLVIADFSISRDDTDASAQQRQAAAFTYSYYTVARIENLRALIYSDIPGASITTAGGVPTTLYNTFRLCGTTKGEELSLLESNMEGAWSGIYPDVKNNETCYFSYSTGVGEIDKSKMNNPTPLYDFSLGNSYGFFGIGHTEYTAIIEQYYSDGSVQSALRVNPISRPVSDEEDKEEDEESTPEYIDTDWAAIRKTSIKGEELISSKYIGIDCSAARDGQRLILVITDSMLRGGGSAIFTGEAVANSARGYQYLDIGEFTDSISAYDELTLTIYVMPDEYGDTSTLTLHNISLFGSSGNGSGSVITVIVVFTIITVLFAALVALIVKRTKKSKKSGAKNK